MFQPFKIAAAFFHAHGFRHGDLNMVDVAPVPDRFKNSIAETEYQNVLDGFFAKVMVDAENLLFGQHLTNLAVQRLGRFQIIAEGFFKDHAPPVAIFFACQFRRSQLFDDVTEKSWAGSEIEEIIAMRVALLVDLGQGLPNSSIECRIMKFAAHVENPLDHPITEFGINRAGCKLIEIIAHDLLILLPAVIVAADAQDREVRSEQFALDQVIDCGEELARSKVAGAAKNDHHTRACRRRRA